MITEKPAVYPEIFSMPSQHLKRDVETVVYATPHGQHERPALLVMNDGQDLQKMGVKKALDELFYRGQIGPVIIAGVKCGPERIQEYGVAGIPDAKKRGVKAAQYTQFILTELLPALHEQLSVGNFHVHAIGGFSLGGLTAFDIAWNHPELFTKAGIFSGSFWWRSREPCPQYTDADRITHRMVRETQGKPGAKFWFQTGTKDETADRNGNGIIDSIDDTTDLMAELRNKGFDMLNDVAYYEMIGGRHDTETWAQAFPAFLVWAFGK
ncbi:MAG: esterase family protein [Mucilaginibacter polytrichastri]|nr:esterase family protein [Mucilaginibacter polytrichastri]